MMSTPVIGKYGQHKFYMYESAGQKKEIKKENTSIVWKGGLKNITNKTQKQIYVHMYSNLKCNGDLFMLSITGLYPHMIFYETRVKQI